MWYLPGSWSTLSDRWLQPLSVVAAQPPLDERQILVWLFPER